jgi:single-strand DNA-binding protein
MNSVNLIGNLTRDPEVRYTQNQEAVCQFSVAINRGKNSNGDDLGADFPRVVVFGRTAENCGKFLKKGSKVGVIGSIRTGSYENNQGSRVYTTDVYASRVEFLTSKNDGQNSNYQKQAYKPTEGQYSDIPEGYEFIDDDDIPF